MQSDEIIRETLQRVGALKPFAAGAEEPRLLTPEEIRHLRDRLAAVAKRNGSLAWVLFLGIFGLAVAAFVITASVGGNLGLISGGFTTMFILPIGNFLRSLWQEKFRLDALWEIFPVLSPSQQSEALTRFLYRDAELPKP